MASVGAVKTSDGYLTARGFTMGKLSPMIRWPCQKQWWETANTADAQMSLT